MASAALDAATAAERVLRTPVRLRFDYDDPSPARQVLRQFDTEVQRSEYTDVTTLTVGVRASEVDAFVEAFTNALSDDAELLRVGSWGLSVKGSVFCGECWGSVFPLPPRSPLPRPQLT